MTIKEAYRNFLVQVQTVYSLNEATVITDWVFETAAHIKRADLIKNPQQPLAVAAEQQVEQYLGQLLQHKPIQYILGEAWFYRMKFKVNENVLIPRPETEELVESIITDCKSTITEPVILDIGTGSGCIAIALKKHLHAALITAVDVSEGALSLAKENASNQNTPVQFLELDFLDQSKWNNLPLYDVIVSNPPYIPIKEKEKLNMNVTGYEPHSALFVPDDAPLLFYKKIALFGKDHLNYNGKIYLETHEDYAQEVAALFISAKYGHVVVKKDLYGKERMVTVNY